MVSSGSIVLYAVGAVATNWLMDTWSFLVTRRVVHQIGERGYLYVLPLVAFDIAAALGISVSVLSLSTYISLYAESVLRGSDLYLPPLGELAISSISWIGAILRLDEGEFRLGPVWVPHTYVAYASTTFVPTLAVMVAIGGLLLLKLSVLSFRAALLSYFNRAVEDNVSGFKPCSLIAAVAALLVAVAKLALETFKWLRS